MMNMIGIVTITTITCLLNGKWKNKNISQKKCAFVVSMGNVNGSDDCTEDDLNSGKILIQTTQLLYI